MELLIILPIALHEMKGKRKYPVGMVHAEKQKEIPPLPPPQLQGSLEPPMGLKATRPDCLNSTPHPDPRPPGAHRLPRGVQVTHRGEGPYPLSSLLPLCTFLHGLEDTSNEALNALLCWVVKMVLGRLGRLWSLLSSEAPFPAPWADLQRLSSSSLFPERSRSNMLSPSRLLPGVVCYSIIRHSGARSEDDLRYE